MSMQDPIADLLTRIRNGLAARKKEITVPSSKMKTNIVKVLADKGYIKSFSVEGDVKKNIIIELGYHKGRPIIDKITRVSRPGLRNYSSVSEMPKVLNGLGIAIVSTSKGVMSGVEARRDNLGGEVLCFVE